MSDLSRRISALSPEQRAVFERRLQQKGLSLHKLPAIPRRSDPGDAPLSFAQERLWFLHQLAPESPVYNGPSAVRLSGPLRVDALQRSLREAARRHETLRTRFVVVDERPLQRIAAAPSLPLPIVDLRALGAPEPHARRLIAAEIRRPFDLAEGAPTRALLLRLSATEHILLFTMHHIISDGWSTELLVQEVAALYEAFAAGMPSPLADLPVQYADYAIWQRGWLQGAAFDTQLGYWREGLAGAPPLLDLPTDRPRPAVQRFQGAVVAFDLPDALHAPFTALSQQADATLFMTLLAAFDVLLARYSGQTDILVGSPVANRARAELAGVIGFFANNLVLRADLSGDPSFRDLLGRVRAVAASAYAHPDLPFELLVKELNPERTLSYAPLFQVAFNLQRVLVPTLERAGVLLRPLVIDNGTAKLDINLFIWETDGRLSGSIEYNTDLFDATTIRRMGGHLRTLLLGIAADPDRRIADLPLLGPAERTQILAEWNDTFGGVRSQRSEASRVGFLHELIAAQAARTPDAVAVVFDMISAGGVSGEGADLPRSPLPYSDRGLATHVTYAELDRRANQLAHHLRALGVGPERVVGVRMERSAELVIALLGVLKAGGAYLPLDPSYPEARIAFILEDSGATALVTKDERPRTNAGGRSQKSGVRSGELTADCAGADDVVPGQVAAPNARRAANDEARPFVLRPSSFVDLGADWPAIAARPADPPAPQLEPDSLAYVIYTSGSTGAPKGALNTQRGIINRLRWMQDAYGLDAEDRVLQKTPFSFDVSVWEFFWPLMTGSALVVARPEGHKDSAYLARLIADQRVTTLHFVPSMLQVFLEERAVERCGALRRVICSGEALPPDLAARFFERIDAELHNLYGPTEAAIDVSAWACAPGRDMQGLPIGRPIRNTQLYVLDRRMRPAPIGIPGELYIGGVQLARGYLARPDLTAERFAPNPFAPTHVAGVETQDIASLQPYTRLYKTGDLARFRPDGAILFLGRIDHQIKLRGFRIELDEITSALAQHPAVREAVALARADRPGDPQIVAYVVPHQGSGVRGPGAADQTLELLAPDPRSLIPALREFLAARLPEYMIPSAFVELDALPLTSNGKLDRRALPAPERPRVEPASAAEAPRGPVEELLAGIWRQLLGVEHIGRDESFFALGGHSLLAARLNARLRDVMQVELSVRDIFEAPTVAGMAARVEAARHAGEIDPPPPLRSHPHDGSAPTSFPQQRLWFLDQLEHGNAAYNIPSAVRLGGALDIRALSNSLNAIIARHEALRTTFASSGGQPVQVIAPRLAIRLPLFDLRGLPPGVREPASRDLIASAAAQPFDLARGPLLRAAIVRMGQEAHILLMTIHHSVSDGWSLGVLVRELAAIYAAEIAGAAPSLPDLPIQYADYAIWQRAWLQGERIEAPMSYWRGQLAGVAPLALPTDHPRPQTPRFRGALRWFTLAPDLSADLAALSRREGVTLFMTLLAAFQALLARYSGQTDITVGSPISGRTQIETEPLIGFFVNTLVLRANLAGNPTMRDLLRQVRDVTLDAYAHQELPFEALVEALQPARGTSRTPLFQVMMILQNAPMPQIDLGGLTLQLVEAESSAAKLDLKKVTGLALQLVEAESGAAKFDLTISMQESDHGLIGMMEYSTDLFEPPTITRIIGHFQRLLAGIAADPSRRLADLPLLTAVERQQTLVEWNDTTRVRGQGSGVMGQRPGVRADAPLHEQISAQIARSPDAVALVFDALTGDEGRKTNDSEPASLVMHPSSPVHVTYSEMERRANQLAHALRARGVGPEALVGLYLARAPEAVVAMLAVWKAGAAYVPLDPTYPSERLAFMFADSQARVLVTNDGGESAALFADRPSFAGAATIDLVADAPQIAGMPANAPPLDGDPDRPLYAIYTSGSTGRPKGVLGLTRGLLNRAAWMAEAAPLAPDERCAQKTALGFVDSIWEICGPLLGGVPLVILPDETVRDGALLLGALERQRITRLVLTPALLRTLLALSPALDATLRTLHVWISSGEALPADLAQQFHARLPGRRLLNLYGSSEVAADVLWSDVSPGATARAPIGRPISNTQAYVLDFAGQPAPIGVPGEIHIGGFGLARGYLGRPGLTSERFTPNQFTRGSGIRDQGSDPEPRPPIPAPRLYRTGDLGRFLADGRIEYLGRIDHQVKVRGYRIELAEIEATLAQHPSVRQAAVGARRAADGEPQLAAYVVPIETTDDEEPALSGAKRRRTNGETSAIGDASPSSLVFGPLSRAAELRDWLRARLPEYMIPATFTALGALPLTPSGKLDRAALPDPDYQADERTYVGPRTQTEATLSAIWSELLGIEPIGVFDDFFDLGGHSLMATRVLAQIHDIFGVQLPLAVVFTNFTIAELGKQIAQRQISAAPVDDVAAMLAHLDTLSDEEVERLLASTL